MWPWHHLAVAYVLYSLFTHLILDRSPTGPETAAVVLGSQLPDLIDKPLTWIIGATSTSYALGHSIFFAPIACLVVYAVTARRSGRTLAGAFSLAYYSHLVTDVFDPTRTDRGLWLRAVLWPIESRPPSDPGGFLDHVVAYLFRYAFQLLTDGLTPQIILQLVLIVALVVLWLFDGAPIAADIRRWLRTRRQT